MKSNKVNSLTNKSALWPSKLDNLHIPPSELFVAGHIPTGPRVGVIGSRRPTTYGQMATNRIVADLVKAGVVIVSGLAIGIDGMAHKAALENGGKTIAILPSSISQVYPSRHQRLAQEIINSDSALITEYGGDHRPRRENFIARNRIIAAYCDVLLVIEANIKSGTSHTVNFALELGIEVAAVPGRIDSNLSQGTHNIIKQGGALIENAADVIHILGMDQIEQSLFNEDPRFKPITNRLRQSDCTIDQLIQLPAYDQAEIFSVMIELEAEGRVARSPEGVYALRW